MKRFRSTLLGAALTVLSAGATTAASGGDLAPACELPSLDDTQRYDTGHTGDKVLYMDFWASWCGPCAKSFPFLSKLHHDLKEKGLQVIGINLDEKPEDAERFLAKFPVDFPIVSDPGQQCARKFDVEAMPSSYLVDRRGIIHHVHLGFRSGDAKELRRMVEQLLAEAPHTP